MALDLRYQKVKPLPHGKRKGEFLVALAGNPNTGKSTVFNGLTGLRQHTGNWPGKTVASAQGRYEHQGQDFLLVDLPGTYSLLSNSVEEEVARDFICFERPDITVVVTDATCLERNLNLVLQILEITSKVIVCVNLMDEAKRKKIHVDLKALAQTLKVPVVGTSARDGVGLEELKKAVYQVALGKIKPEGIVPRYPQKIEELVAKLRVQLSIPQDDGRQSRWAALRLLEGDEGIVSSMRAHWIKSNTPLSYDLAREQKLRDQIAGTLVRLAEAMSKQTVSYGDDGYRDRDRKIDHILTSRHYGFPIMLIILGVIFWITIVGANYPSELLAQAFNVLEGHLQEVLVRWKWPSQLREVLILGVYRTCAWVISVMLPPMAIFFPLFTFLEDLGYLPRVAFNLDNFFKRACAHGKQALTMGMGFGCNAAGIMSCRIIDSPRERLIAILTNNFVPCNGRFPLLIVMSTLFIAESFGKYRSLVAAISLLVAISIGVGITLLISALLSKTLLKGLPSSFMLELPPYRPPKMGRILVRSLIDRTLAVLFRAVIVAIPAGFILWIMANKTLGGVTILAHFAQTLDPLAKLMGLDGYILTAFILGLPANEIVVPIMIMGYMSTGALLELGSLLDLKMLLIAHNWTGVTALCTMLFSLNHFPCGTTLLTIYKETQSLKWTVLSFLIPTLVGAIACILLAQGARILTIFC